MRSPFLLLLLLLLAYLLPSSYCLPWAFGKEKGSENALYLCFFQCCNVYKETQRRVTRCYMPFSSTEEILILPNLQFPTTFCLLSLQHQQQRPENDWWKVKSCEHRPRELFFEASSSGFPCKFRETLKALSKTPRIDLDEGLQTRFEGLQGAQSYPYLCCTC